VVAPVVDTQNPLVVGDVAPGGEVFGDAGGERPARLAGLRQVDQPEGDAVVRVVDGAVGPERRPVPDRLLRFDDGEVVERSEQGDSPERP